MYNLTEEIIHNDIDQVAHFLLQGWRLNGYTDHDQLAYSLLYECKYY
ncbi:hypothetical protein [Ammoniphilus sp. YIM 78166]|nr:hypothetical protein [Ammoniphilus sp. YIM 78166]